MRSFDIAVILLYLAGIIWAGLHFRGKNADADEFFTAKGGFVGKLGTFMVGLSMAATLFSGVSFVIYTSTAFSTGARIVLGAAALPMCWVVLRFWFLSRYIAGSGNHPYDIVERRLGPEMRLCLSAMFILLRLAWMAVMLVAPTLVLMGAAGLGPEWFWPIVITTGVACTLYTTIGGIRSVIITDAIQFLVMALGLLLIIYFGFTRLDLPVADIVGQLRDAGRLKVFDFSFDLTQSFTFWGIIFGLSVGNLGSYMGDLMMLQRYLAAESPQAAARAFAVNVIGAFCVAVSLVVVGLLMWVWYQHHPDPNLPDKPDQVMSYFIAREMPAGMSGLLIAAILAATMSSMTSGVIALAGTITNDWIRRFGRPRSQQELLVCGRYLSLAVGILAMLAAGLAGRLGTIFQVSQAMMGAFLGPMLACMTIVVSSWQVRPRVVFTGMALGTIVGWIVIISPVAPVWVATSSALVTLIVAALFRTRPAGQDPQ